MCFSVEINRDLKTLSKIFGATIDKDSFVELNSLKESNPKIYKVPGEDNKIFPNVHAPVVIMKDGQRALIPMRYRVRPHDSPKEIPSKYNLFNARYDSLLIKKTWKDLFGKKHGLFPFKRFFEWVEGPDHKKQLISFSPKDHELMWAPCLYDIWEDKNLKIISFALITDDPPLEVLNAGHDRCPIFLNKKYWDNWLNPESFNKVDLLNMIKNKENVKYIPLASP